MQYRQKFIKTNFKITVHTAAKLKLLHKFKSADFHVHVEIYLFLTIPNLNFISN